MMNQPASTPLESSSQPASVGEPSAQADPTARVLLPVLLHEVNNATQLLVGLRAILELPGGEAMFNSRADDLARTSAMMDDLGFALAVVATAGGANMLLARRDERSIQIMWELTCQARGAEDQDDGGAAPDGASGPGRVAAGVVGGGAADRGEPR